MPANIFTCTCTSCGLWNLCRFINLLEPVRACNDQIINYLLFIKRLLFAHICFPLSDYFVHRSLLFRKCSCELSLCQPATQCNKKKKQKKKIVNLRFASPTFASPNLASLTFASPTFALPNEQSPHTLHILSSPIFTEITYWIVIMFQTNSRWTWTSNKYGRPWIIMKLIKMLNNEIQTNK